MPAADASLAALFGRWQGERAIALAVSGGADSLALAVLADRWRRSVDPAPRLVVLSVDHGLRREAAAEVAMVGALAQRLGLDFRPLRVIGPAPEADIEALARAARYRLLIEAARAAGASVLMTAHHADDQAETFLLRLARGSGVYGLAAMAVETERDGLRIARPLLSLSRADLAAVVAAAGLVAAVDPHNADDRFARARLRKLTPALAAEGLDAPTLAATAARLRRAASALDDYADRLLAAASVDVTGAVRLGAAAFAAEPEETRLRVLARILRAAGGADYVPRLDSVAGLAAAMVASGGSLSRRTLAGVVVDGRKGAFRFQRETGRAGLPDRVIEAAFAGVWDGRFAVRVETAGEAVVLSALGAAGRRVVGACLPEGLPLAMDASPALFRNGTLVAAPPLGMPPPASSGLTAEIRSIVAIRLLERTPGNDL